MRAACFELAKINAGRNGMDDRAEHFHAHRHHEGQHEARHNRSRAAKYRPSHAIWLNGFPYANSGFPQGCSRYG
jgi:hypothetical protein